MDNLGLVLFVSLLFAFIGLVIHSIILKIAARIVTGNSVPFGAAMATCFMMFLASVALSCGVGVPLSFLGILPDEYQGISAFLYYLISVPAQILVAAAVISKMLDITFFRGCLVYVMTFVVMMVIVLIIGLIILAIGIPMQVS